MIAAALETVEELGANRRRVARRRLRLNIPSAIGGIPAQDVVVHDISSSGLLLESPVPLADGETLTVELPEAPSTVAGVVWSSGRFYGCQFDVPLPAAAIAASLLRSPIERPAAPVPAEADELLLQADDRIGRGPLGISTRLQIVLAISLGLWLLLLKAVGIF